MFVYFLLHGSFLVKYSLYKLCLEESLCSSTDKTNIENHLAILLFFFLISDNFFKQKHKYCYPRSTEKEDCNFVSFTFNRFFTS